MSEPMTKVTREELRSALRTTKTRLDHRFPLSNGWFVTAQRIYPQPARIGRAWFFLFHIESPTGKRFGGRTNVAEMVAFFCNPRAWQWRDAYVDIHLTQKQTRDGAVLESKEPLSGEPSGRSQRDGLSAAPSPVRDAVRHA